MSGLGLLSDYNNDSELSEPEDKTETSSESKTQSVNGPDITEKLKKLSKESVSSDKANEQDDNVDRSSEHSAGKSDSNSDDKNRDRHRDRHSSDGSRGNRSHGDRSSDNSSRGDRHRSDRSRDDKYRRERSRDGDDKKRTDHAHHKRDDRSSRDHDRSRDYKRRDHRGRDFRGRDHRGRDFRGRGHRGDHRIRSGQEEKDREFEEYRRRKYGDSRDWGKVSADSLKDVKTDATLPSSFDNTIAKQLAAQREKRKLLWGKKEGEGSGQKSVWGTGSLKNDESGEQTAKFLKLMGVRDVTAENVKDYKKSDESVLRSSEAVDSMETEYEKSRYMQHINKGVGLGMIQFTKPPPPT